MSFKKVSYQKCVRLKTDEYSIYAAGVDYQENEAPVFSFVDMSSCSGILFVGDIGYAGLHYGSNGEHGARKQELWSLISDLHGKGKDPNDCIVSNGNQLKVLCFTPCASACQYSGNSGCVDWSQMADIEFEHLREYFISQNCEFYPAKNIAEVSCSITVTYLVGWLRKL